MSHRRHAYGVVVAGVLLQVLVWSFYNSFGIFLLPMTADTGWTRTEATTAFTVATVAFGICSVLAGRLADFVGARLVVLGCGVISVAGYALASRADSPATFALTLGLLTGVGLSGSYVPLASHMARWFTRQRGAVLGIIVSSSAVGAAFGPPLSEALIDVLGWRGAYQAFAVLLACALPLVVLLLRHPPDLVGPDTTSETTPGTEDPVLGGSLTLPSDRRRFILLIAGVWLIHGFVAAGVTAHLYAHATTVGIASSAASQIIGAIGLLGIVGGLVGGWSADLVGPGRALVMSVAVIFASFVVLIAGTQTGVVAVAAMLFGFGWYACASLEPIVVAAALGVRGLGVRLGYLEVVWAIGGGLGPLVLARIFASTGGYGPGWWLFGALAVVAVAIAIILSNGMATSAARTQRRETSVVSSAEGS